MRRLLFREMKYVQVAMGQEIRVEAKAASAIHVREREYGKTHCFKNNKSVTLAMVLVL